MIKTYQDLEKKIKQQQIQINPDPSDVDEDYVKSLNIDYNTFKKKYYKLCRTWWGKNCEFSYDCEGKCFVTNIIGSHINEPIIISIIADDVNVFKKYMNDRHIYNFDFCCICGSNNIIEHIYLTSYLQSVLESNDAVAYALSSCNYKLAKDLAILFKNNNKEHGHIYLYSGWNKESQLCAKEISMMFTQ